MYTLCNSWLEWLCSWSPLQAGRIYSGGPLLGTIEINPQYQHVFKAVSFGFFAAVAGSVSFYIVGLGGYTLVMFLICWAMFAVIEKIRPTI